MRTPTSHALGRALRQAREGMELKLRDFTAKLGRDPGMLSPLGSRRAHSQTRPGRADPRTRRRQRRTPRRDHPPHRRHRANQWLALTLPEQREQLNTLVNLEQSTTRITEVPPMLISGLLQTTPYIRAILPSGSVPPDEIAIRVAIRNGRKAILKRHNPVRLIALIGEAALNQLIGSSEVMAEQLRYLLEAATWPNVNLRIIPFSVDGTQAWKACSSSSSPGIPHRSYTWRTGDRAYSCTRTTMSTPTGKPSRRRS
jgi:hypothetical protein